MSSNQELKDKILKEFDSLDPQEQQILLGIVENYFHNKADETEWENLPPNWKLRIEESLKQADENQFILHEDAMSYLRKKYQVNG